MGRPLSTVLSICARKRSAGSVTVESRRRRSTSASALARREGAITALDRLKEIIDRLRSPDGCPWDREQTSASLKPFLLEEAHEVADAIDGGEAAALKEELGDLLMNIFLQSRIAEEKGVFTLDEVAACIADKLIRRHPHVFAGGTAASSADVRRTWEEIKAQERGGSKTAPSALRKLPASLSALMQADRLGRMAAEVGFDWRSRSGPLAKLDEELRELQCAIASESPQSIERELGDLLFAACSVARHCDIEPEFALKRALDRFRKRFAYVEAKCAGRSDLTLELMEEFWQEAKSKED